MTFELTIENILLIFIAITLLVIAIRLFFFSKGDDREIINTRDILKDHIKEQLEHSRNLSSEQQSRTIEEKFQKVIKELSGNNQEALKNLHEFREQFSIKLTGDFESLSALIEKRLDHISKRVQENLDEGFKKTNLTFQSVIERLTKIDEAQKNIEKLSSNVVSLQDVLTDKKSRGIFGEVQLSHLLSTVFGDKNDQVYQLQHQLPGNKIVDAIIFLPEPTGSIAIDSKFPLENYRRIVESGRDTAEMKKAQTEFKRNVKKHIDDIASKYIIPGVTAEHAILFLPAEAIFAEINAYHPDIVDYSHHKKVALTSPTTFMSLLTTIQVTLNNMERDKYTNIIHDELRKLGVEFNRYQERWDKLSKHIDTVSKSVKDVHTTSEKIGKRFAEISEVRIDTEKIDEPQNDLLIP